MQIPKNFFACNKKALLILLSVCIIALAVICTYYGGEEDMDGLFVLAAILWSLGLAVGIGGFRTTSELCEY